MLDAEPGEPGVVSNDRADDVLAAFADLADLKSTWFRGHSRAVSELAAGTASASVGHHVEHIFAKAGVATRAGATFFAMEHDLIRA